MTGTLSISDARKLVLHSQRVLPARQSGPAVGATKAAIEHLGYIQIDTISVIERAHHHTLWNRNPRYQPHQLDQLVENGDAFEYWAHAAAYLPMSEFRFSLPRKEAFASGKQSHWYACDEKLMAAVRERIAAEGPLMAKDFEHTGADLGEWQAKPAKKALENLFMQGALMAPRRINFHKVYDLTERVVPAGTDTRMPGPEEYARFLIARYLRANGLGSAAEIAYLLKGTKPVVAQVADEMIASGEVHRVDVGGQSYLVHRESLGLLEKPLARSRLKILSPFDNLVIQRKRMVALFDFDYLIECYLPAAKRRYGYFSLPVLWDGRLVARMDCKAVRSEEVLEIRHLALEPGLRDDGRFARALAKELAAFVRFNRCGRLRLLRVTPGRHTGVVGEALAGIEG